MSERSERLNLDSLLKDDSKKIYVRNNALMANMLLVLEMRDSNGKSVSPFKLPPTELPFCLTDEYSRDMIRNCSELRKHLSKKTIVLVDEVEAEEFLARPDSLEEMQALSVSYYSDSAPPNAIRDALVKLRSKSGAAEPVVVNSEQLKANVQDDKVSPRVRGLVASFQSKEKSAKETLISLRRTKSTLSVEELTFLITECREDSAIREFAEVELAGRNSVPNA